MKALEDGEKYLKKVEEFGHQNKLPEGIKDREDYMMVFGNIRALKERNFRVFNPELGQAARDKNVNLFLLNLKRHKDSIIVLYSNYGEKRSKSEYLLNKHKKFFKASKIFEEQFPPPCLENPTIFLSENPIIWEDMKKLAKKHNLPQTEIMYDKILAIYQEILCLVMHVLDAGYIENFPSLVEEQGTLFMTADLDCVPPKKSGILTRFMQRRVDKTRAFLFQQALVIAKLENKTPPGTTRDIKLTFMYRIPLNHLMMRIMGNENAIECYFEGQGVRKDGGRTVNEKIRVKAKFNFNEEMIKWNSKIQELQHEMRMNV